MRTQLRGPRSVQHNRDLRSSHGAVEQSEMTGAPRDDAGKDLARTIGALALYAASLAADQQGTRTTPEMTFCERRRFEGWITEAAIGLRGIPIRPPADPLVADARRAGFRTAWRLSGTPKDWRKALRATADQIRVLPEAEWNLTAAMAVEAEPAMLAWWLVRTYPLPLIVENGVLPSKADTVARLEDLAAQIPSRPGRPHAVHDAVDAAIIMLLHAYGIAAGRQGRAAFKVSLSNAAAGTQRDSGPAVDFVREAIRLLAPEVAAVLGSQAIIRAARRARSWSDDD